MRILMLGWEFPPYIAGGLGVACEGLTRALNDAGHHIIFVLPQPVDAQPLNRVRIVGRHRDRRDEPDVASASVSERAATSPPMQTQSHVRAVGALIPQRTTLRTVAAGFSSPYPATGARGWTQSRIAEWGSVPGTRSTLSDSGAPGEPRSAQSGEVAPPLTEPESGPVYAGDLLAEAQRYARACVRIAREEEFDIVHAHDWLTFPAGLAIRRATGRPLVVHVHSTEFDRSGSRVNPRVYEVEREGMLGADRVITVSRFTASICEKRYGCPASKIEVVYNGVDIASHDAAQRSPSRIEGGDRIVLFLGRITMQKGPEYFLAAAQRVLEKMSNVKFVLAGSGDMALRMAEMASGMGIGDKVFFTGFLRGQEVERVFRMADCFVMPSVSEPFGIAALEALSHGVPVILSKTSGAGEVLEHVLKVDFWDADGMADRILAVLRRPPLSQTLREHASKELQRLTWGEASRKCVSVYERLLAESTEAVRAR